MQFYLFEVSYISCEGNSRTANIIISSLDEVSSDTAQSVYYENSGCYGDDPAQMTDGYLITVSDSKDEMDSYCNSSNIFADYYDYS